MFSELINIKNKLNNTMTQDCLKPFDLYLQNKIITLILSTLFKNKLLIKIGSLIKRKGLRGTNKIKSKQN